MINKIKIHSNIDYKLYIMKIFYKKKFINEYFLVKVG